jgi:hypothetical protein
MFAAPRITAPTSQGVLCNDQLRPDPWRVAWELVLGPGASAAGGRCASGVHADADATSQPSDILARGFNGPFEQFYAEAGERRWWQAELACGHDVMLDMPNELTALLLQQR